MQLRLRVFWRTEGWKCFAPVECGHVHFRKVETSLADFQCFCERPMFDATHEYGVSRALTMQVLEEFIESENMWRSYEG